MTDNRSLDEFLATEAGGESDGAGAAGAEEADPGSRTPPEPEPASATLETEANEPVEPMAETVVWSSAGGECARCGATVEERWRDGDALVCADCKAW